MAADEASVKQPPETPAKGELNKIAERIRERTFGSVIRDYVRTDVHGYSRVVIRNVGVRKR